MATFFKNSITKQTKIGEKSIKVFPSGVLFNKLRAGSSKNSVSSYIIVEKEFVLPKSKSHDIITRINIKNSSNLKKNNMDCKRTKSITKHLYLSDEETQGKIKPLAFNSSLNSPVIFTFAGATIKISVETRWISPSIA